MLTNLNWKNLHKGLVTFVSVFVLFTHLHIIKLASLVLIIYSTIKKLEKDLLSNLKLHCTKVYLNIFVQPLS